VWRRLQNVLIAFSSVSLQFTFYYVSPLQFSFCLLSHEVSFRCVFADRLCGLVIRVPGCKQRSRVRFPALLNFVRNKGSGTGSTQPLCG
jgi:hypothetical protein